MVEEGPTGEQNSSRVGGFGICRVIITLSCSFVALRLGEALPRTDWQTGLTEAGLKEKGEKQKRKGVRRLTVGGPWLVRGKNTDIPCLGFAEKMAYG